MSWDLCISKQNSIYGLSCLSTQEFGYILLCTLTLSFCCLGRQEIKKKNMSPSYSHQRRSWENTSAELTELLWHDGRRVCVMRQNCATTHLSYPSQKKKKKRNKFTECTGHWIEWPLKGLNCVGKYSTQWHFKHSVAYEVSESLNYKVEL